MICQQCGKENPAGSNFCNHCGARLTAVEGPAGIPGGPESPESFPQPAGPTDEPEELDWGEGVPDWLMPDAQGDEQPLPHAGEDLPTWLLDEDTAEALDEDAGAAGERPGVPGSAADDDADTAAQELPEWLRGLAPTGTGPLPSSRVEPADETQKPSLDDWLADLAEPPEASQEPSWLAGIEPEDEEAAASVESWPDDLEAGFEDRVDWLGELDVGDAVQTGAGVPDEPWAGAEQSGFDMDDWLAEMGPTEQPAAAESAGPPEAEDAVEDRGIPDRPASDEERSPATKEPQFNALEAIPEWLADLEAKDGGETAGPGETSGEEAELTGHPGGKPAGPAPEMSGVPDDWLSSLEDDWRDEGPETGAAGIPDWLAEPSLPKPPEDTPDEELPPWLEESAFPAGFSGSGARTEGLPAASEEGDDGETAPGEVPELDWWPAGEEAPDWLLVAEEPEKTEAAAQAQDEDSDWLSELDAAIGELEAASQEVTSGTTGEAAAEGVPSGGEEPETSAEEVETPMAGEPAGEEEVLPSWLAATELRAHLDEVAFEPLDQPEAVAGEGEEGGVAPEGEAVTGGVPDWLQELEATRPAAGETEALELPDWLQEAAPDQTPTGEALPTALEEGSLTFDTIPAEGAEDEELPDWLVEVTAADTGEIAGQAGGEQADLGALGEEAEEEAGQWPLASETAEEGPEVAAILGQEGGEEIVGADELPDWLGDVVGAEAGELPAYLDDGEAVPDVLAGPQLPKWLEDSLPDEERAEPTPLEELPPWLVPPVGAEAHQPDLKPEAEASGEWAGVLGELAESEAAGAELSAAEIPEWLEALRPQEELRDTVATLDAEPVTEGPLAGLRGAITVMPVVAASRSAEYGGEPEVSPEQQEQAELLRQLVRQEPQEATRVVAPERVRPSPWLRLVLTLLLLGAVVAGLLLPDLLDVGTAPVIPVAPVGDVLEQAAGRPVLVVFDYTPAYAGILNDQAGVLLQVLAAQDSQVVYASQSAAGLGLGTTAVEAVEELETQRLGYIAGETLGLRRLARCLDTELPGAAACENYPPGTGEVAAVLLLTGERDSLVDWIEQVETVSHVPLLAGVTEALVPVAMPYYATGQLDGVVAGQAATAAIADASGVQDVQPSTLPLALAAWLVAALLLVGNVIFFFIGLVGSRRTRKA